MNTHPITVFQLEAQAREWAEHEVTNVTATGSELARAAIADIAFRAYLKGYAAGAKDGVTSLANAIRDADRATDSREDT